MSETEAVTCSMSRNQPVKAEGGVFQVMGRVNWKRKRLASLII